jgi:hypothetical protein
VPQGDPNQVSGDRSDILGKIRLAAGDAQRDKFGRGGHGIRAGRRGGAYGGRRSTGLYSDENLGLLLNALGLDPPPGALAAPHRVPIGLRTRDLFPAMIKAQCAAGLVVLRIEDVHWIDSASEELLTKLIKDNRQLNLLVIHIRPPEYTPSWSTQAFVKPLALPPLGADDIRHLAQNRLGVQDLPADLA